MELTACGGQGVEQWDSGRFWPCLQNPSRFLSPLYYQKIKRMLLRNGKSGFINKMPRQPWIAVVGTYFLDNLKAAILRLTSSRLLLCVWAVEPRGLHCRLCPGAPSSCQGPTRRGHTFCVFLVLRNRPECLTQPSKMYSVKIFLVLCVSWGWGWGSWLAQSHWGMS